ncbi:MAG: MiaB/RimO family radical SAM methylthiotransferase [bacterium]|nr:MiaB/RimO family radical SAM methylthiotransferase [bacterium]
MKYFLQVFGCQMNTSDSERVATVLDNLGYRQTKAESQADLILVIACAVRQAAVDRIYGRAVKWAEWRKQHGLVTVLTGCVLEHDRKKMRPIFDLIFPMKDLKKLPRMLEDRSDDIVKNEPAPLDEYFEVLPRYNSGFQAYVPISTGCNKFCTYCAVPFTRGREISREPDEVVEEIAKLVKKGCKEITLLGQNVNSYGWDFEGVSLNLPKGKVLIYKPDAKGELAVQKRRVKSPTNFPGLLKRIAVLPGDFWVRFITSHPYDMSDELIKTVSKYDKLTPYIHLPIQAGSDSVLKKMNRLYTIEHYLERLRKVRQHIPDSVISTDIIVGFAGETKADFEKTVDLVRDVKYDMAFIAQYSVRPGTIASDWKDNVPAHEKKRRDEVLNEVLKHGAYENNRRLLGWEQEVLFEKDKKGFSFGKTKGFKNIRVPSSVKLAGQFGRVTVTEVSPWSLSGELIR